MTLPDTTDREELAALMVFLANDTLDGPERDRVEAAIAADPALQDELAALRAIRFRMQEEALPYSPGAFGKARLLRAIEAEAPARRGWLWPAAVAAAVALLAVHTAFVWQEDGLRLADGGVEVATGPLLTVAFAGTATEADIRALLLELDLTIVSGPSAIGLYRLAARDEAAREAALARFAAEPAIVDSAEAAE